MDLEGRSNYFSVRVTNRIELSVQNRGDLGFLLFVFYRRNLSFDFFDFLGRT